VHVDATLSPSSHSLSPFVYLSLSLSLSLSGELGTPGARFLSMGSHTLFTFQRERERDRKKEKERERKE
jgi:hypothetical protein